MRRAVLQYDAGSTDPLFRSYMDAQHVQPAGDALSWKDDGIVTMPKLTLYLRLILSIVHSSGHNKYAL